MIEIRDRLVSLVALDDLLTWGGSAHPSARNGTAVEAEKRTVVVAHNGETTIGLLVDQLIGMQEIVLKPLEKNFRPVPSLSGASILGDGRVSLILDVDALIGMVVQGGLPTGGLRPAIPEPSTETTCWTDLVRQPEAAARRDLRPRGGGRLRGALALARPAGAGGRGRGRSGRPRRGLRGPRAGRHARRRLPDGAVGRPHRAAHPRVRGPLRAGDGRPPAPPADRHDQRPGASSSNRPRRRRPTSSAAPISTRSPPTSRRSAPTRARRRPRSCRGRPASATSSPRACSSSP